MHPQRLLLLSTAALCVASASWIQTLQTVVKGIAQRSSNVYSKEQTNDAIIETNSLVMEPEADGAFVDLPEDQAVYSSNVQEGTFHCCSMHGKGHYYANISFDGLGRRGCDGDMCGDDVHGYVAVNADTQQFAISLGSQDIRQSPAGWYAGICKGNQRAFAAAWNKRSCKVYGLPHGVPKMCFGQDSYYPVLHSKVNLDILTYLLKYTDKYSKSTVAINPLTCMPYWQWSERTFFFNDEAELLSPNVPAGRLRNSDAVKDEEEDFDLLNPDMLETGSGYLGIRPYPKGRRYMVMQNATAWPPHHDKFGFPPRCTRLIQQTMDC